MCGLVGLAGNFDRDDPGIFKELLWVDTLRGPHSTGAAFVGGGDRVTLVKNMGPAPHLLGRKDFQDECTAGKKAMIGHNRFATVGAQTVDNAHPFEFENVVGAHNGTLDLRSRARLPKFDTDSEGLYAAISEHGIREVIPQISGAWALTWFNKKTGTINFLRNKERPLFYTLNKAQDTVYWASDIHMLRLCLARGGVNYETILSLNPDVHVEFSVPFKWGEKIKEVRVEDLKGYVAPTPKSYLSPGSQLNLPGAQEKQEVPWNFGEVLKNWGTENPKSSLSKKEEQQKNAVEKKGSRPGIVYSKGALDSAFDGGWAAAEKGWSIQRNPFSPGIALHESWREGFLIAKQSKARANVTVLYPEKEKVVPEESDTVQGYQREPLTKREFDSRTDNVCAWSGCPIEWTDNVQWFDKNTCVCTSCVNPDNENLFEKTA